MLFKAIAGQIVKESLNKSFDRVSLANMNLKKAGG
jgi:hypothetical protein